MKVDALLLPSHVRRRLAAALESDQLRLPPSEDAVRMCLGGRDFLDPATALLEEFRELGVSARGAGAWLRALESSLCREPLADLVWTGPQVAGLHARETRSVYEEMIDGAQRSIWLSTFAFYDGPKAFHRIAECMSSKPDLRVRLLLNIQRRRGDTTAAEQLVARFSEAFWRQDWPGTRRPFVYYDPRSLELEGPSGVLHAKATIVDEHSLFLTSANLTEAACDRNIELGVLLHDRTMALTAIGYFQGLIDAGLLSELP